VLASDPPQASLHKPLSYARESRQVAADDWR